MEETGRLDSPVWTCCCVVVTEKDWRLVSLCHASDDSHSALLCAGHGGVLPWLNPATAVPSWGFLHPALIFMVPETRAVTHILSAVPRNEVGPQTGQDWRTGLHRCQSHFMMEL